MSDPAFELHQSKSRDHSEDRNSTERIAGTHTDELVIALCGPIGSPLHGVAEQLKKFLEQDYGYDRCEIIRLSDIIQEFSETNIPDSDNFEKIKALIEAGNALREEYGPSILAELAISKISLDREKELVEGGEVTPKPRRVCHIVDSIKNQEELDVLQVVYREMLNFVGVFSPIDVRIQSLRDKDISLPQIHQLIDQDSGEEIDYGQTVRDTFPQADFFLRIDANTRTQLSDKVERFLDLIIGTQVITPTPSETAMYMAASAATNSACLSRQVGAALTDKDGNILSVGWNDVPKFNGGLYYSDPINDAQSQNDKRCWNVNGQCQNDAEKKLISQQVAQALVEEGFVSADNKESLIDSLRKHGKLKGLIEFSRAVHAEMHSIISAGAKSGSRIRGGKLYCTTYPCHSCARHIIAAGINEVYYIEPYRKSLAVKLHGDAITEDESKADRVRLLPYEGVAPSKYLQLFRMAPNSRKDSKTGKMLESARGSARPKITKTLEALPALEGVVLDSLKHKKIFSRGKSDGEQR